MEDNEYFLEGLNQLDKMKTVILKNAAKSADNAEKDLLLSLSDSINSLKRASVKDQILTVLSRV